MRNLKSYVKVMLVNIFGQAKVNTSEVACAFIAQSHQWENRTT